MKILGAYYTRQAYDTQWRIIVRNKRGLPFSGPLFPSLANTLRCGFAPVASRLNCESAAWSCSASMARGMAGAAWVPVFLALGEGGR